MNNKGQSVFSEHVMIFFVVIAAIVAMTTYVQRSFEGRIHDARNYMINSVNSVCDASCQQATGGNIFYEYEPYYQQQISNVWQNESENKEQTNGSTAVIGVTYIKSTNQQTNSDSLSCQPPPICANINGPLPCYCTCPATCGVPA